ncbi:citrate/2-methylcitrate synthase [Trichlorobacter lovleyi]|uniref:citrate/2-methylcitrate synthase n=1 Tax=Trichlorobacter lovleyi TaxID=313985 RepID=UPI0023F53DCC|nr:citrate/2-methylcitrate synthase [Trichlorobacter lovleyi]
MNGPDFLQQHTDRLKSRMGACFPGERAVFRGHDLHAELRDMDWVELFVFGITGRRLTPQQLRLLHAIWVYTSYPDARIWNNRVAALAGSSRSTPTLALAASLAVSEATVYGGYPSISAFDFFMRTRKKIAQGEHLEEIIHSERQTRRIYGYGRPITSADERLPWLLERARELCLDQGPYLRLAFDVERVLLKDNPLLRMNYAGLVAALSLDLGFSAREFHLFRFPMTFAGMPPCFLESSQETEGAFLPLSCAHIVYEGTPKRSWQSRTAQPA